MENGCANLTGGAACLVRLLKIEGISAMLDSKDDCIKTEWNVDGSECIIRLYPAKVSFDFDRGDFSVSRFVELELLFLSKPRICTATLTCRLIDPTGKLEPGEEKSVLYDHPQSSKRKNPRKKKGRNVGVSCRLLRTEELAASGYLRDDTLTVQCAITVLKQLPDPAINGKEVAAPSYTLNQHLGELLQAGTGADVTFLVSGESFAAHKNILAARSRVFMAEFFGDMKEKCSQLVKIDYMEAEAFKALLHFIYTDTVPEFEEEVVTVMAQHLFAAADRYGLDRLKLICVGKLSGGISIGTAATTLALADQHSCPQLKAKCVEFIRGAPEILDAVLATDAYKHLESSCPLVVIDLLRSACCRKI